MKSLFSFFVSILLVTVLAIGCKKDSLRTCEEHVIADCVVDSNKVNVRVQNISEYNICNLEIETCCGIVNHGILEPDSITCYRAFDTVWASTYVHFFVDDHEFVWQATDHFGEARLDTGNYTLKINITNLKAEHLRATYVLDTL